MDTVTLGAALSIMKKMPDTAASSAAAAEDAADRAEAAAESARTLTIDKTLTQAGQAADSKVVGDKISDLKSTLSNLITFAPYDRQLYDVSTLPDTPYMLTANSSGVVSENPGLRLYPIEINGKTGEKYTFDFLDNASGSVGAIKAIDIWASDSIPEVGNTLSQNGFVSLSNKRGTITLGQDSKFLNLIIQPNGIPSYPAGPFTDAANALMGHLVLRKELSYGDVYYAYEEHPVYAVVPYEQGAENYGKILKVNAGGTLELTDESGGGGGSVPDNAIGYYDTLKLNVGGTVLTSDVTLGTGWSGNLTDGFSHASGSAEPLIFNVPTENGIPYIVDFDTSNQAENAVYVSIGNEPLVDPYNGTGHIRIGIISDGGTLKLTPASGFISTITNITCRKVIAEGGTELTQYVRNVKDIGLEDNLSGFWNVAIGGDNTLKNNQNGSRNVGIGYMALHDLKTGTRNIAIGTFAMPYVQSGDRNVSIGADTLYDTKSITTRKAVDNVVIGKAALQSGSNIYENVAIGTNAMGSCYDTSHANVAIGKDALYYGQNNSVAIGTRANYFGRGSNTVAIGYGAGADNSDTAKSGANSIAIGYEAHYTKANQMMLGGSSITEVVMCGNKKINFNADGTVTWETLS